MLVRRRQWSQQWLPPAIGLLGFILIVYSLVTYFNPVLPKSLIYGAGWRPYLICAGCRRYTPYYVTISDFDKTVALNLFTHDPKTDLVSRELHKARALNDIPILDLTKAYLDVFPDIDYVIDIGAHIGAVTMLAAMMNRKVISIEADEESLKVLCSSVIYSSLQDKITIINGVVGVSHKPVTWIYQKNGNHTGSYVDLSDNTWAEIKADSSWDFDARMPFLLDDLLPVLSNISEKNVLIVIDANGFENIILMGAHLFLRMAECRGILVNFSSHKNKKSGRDIVQIIENIELQPYMFTGITLIHLDKDKLGDWPDLVMWL